MNKINLFLIIFFTLFSHNVWAVSPENDPQYLSYKNNFLKIKINYSSQANLKKVQNSLNLIKKATLSPYILNNLDSLSVEINVTKQSKKISISNAAKKCEITLNYDIDLRGVLLDSYEEDLLFTYFHEISHCILGKEIFKDGLQWNNSLKLNQEQIKQNNEKIDILTDEATIKEQCSNKCLATNVFKKPHPLVVYHEIFADIMGMFFYQEYDCKAASKIFGQIEGIRFDSYTKYKVKNVHQSFRAFNFISFRELCNKPIDFKEISFYTQQGFLDYLNNLEQDLK